MNLNNISSIVALLAALSVASERLVEIIKGMLPFLSQQSADPNAEGRRQTMLHILAVLSGMLTAWLASGTAAVQSVLPDSRLGWIVIGLLASGGSGFWNSILGYVNKAKEVKKAEVENTKIDTAVKKAAIVPV
jgi:hypothetical protein